MTNVNKVTTLALAFCLTLSVSTALAAPAKVIVSVTCEATLPPVGTDDNRGIDRCDVLFTDGTKSVYWMRDGTQYISYAGAWNKRRNYTF